MFLIGVICILGSCAESQSHVFHGDSLVKGELMDDYGTVNIELHATRVELSDGYIIVYAEEGAYIFKRDNIRKLKIIDE
jgi:hypothetical protein